MTGILTGTLLISLLHAIIPSHWLPVLAIGRREKWTITEVTRVAFITALAHVLSTVLIGLLLGWIGWQLSERIETFTHVVAPVILIVLGLVFVYRHYRHHHFHLHGGEVKARTKRSIIISLSLAMFLSPCMEIEAYFLLAGAEGNWLLITVALTYGIITISGMLLLTRLAYTGLLKLNPHKWEHNAGIITGCTLIITGIITFFIH